MSLPPLRSPTSGPGGPYEDVEMVGFAIGTTEGPSQAPLLLHLEASSGELSVAPQTWPVCSDR